MNHYFLDQCQAGYGGESDERCFVEKCKCKSCNQGFDETEMQYSDMQFGLVCTGCFEQEQTEFK
jgi:hypothetical protein